MLSKVEAKRLYDKEYRRLNKAKISARKKAYYDNTYKPIQDAKQKELRKTKKYKDKHAEYCRQPEYRKYKHKYDVVKQAMARYGEFWEASILVTQIEKEIFKWIPKYERHYFTNNVRNQSFKNNERRLTNAINIIMKGGDTSTILQGNWLKSSRDILSDLLVRK